MEEGGGGGGGGTGGRGEVKRNWWPLCVVVIIWSNSYIHTDCVAESWSTPIRNCNKRRVTEYPDRQNCKRRR